LALSDLDEEMRQREYSPHLRREVKVAILRHAWSEEESTANRPLRPRIGGNYEGEVAATQRRFRQIERRLELNQPNVNEVWTLTFQAAWAMYRHEETAIQREFSPFARFEERLKEIMRELRMFISFKNKTFDKLWKWIFRASKRRQDMQERLLHRQERAELEDEIDQRRHRGIQMVRNGVQAINDAANAQEAIYLHVDESEHVVEVSDEENRPSMHFSDEEPEQDQDVLQIDLPRREMQNVEAASSPAPLNPTRNAERDMAEERLRRTALETLRTNRLRALGMLPNPTADSPTSPAKESPVKRRLGARMSTGGKRRKITPQSVAEITNAVRRPAQPKPSVAEITNAVKPPARPKLRSAIVVPPTSTARKSKAHAKDGSAAIGSKAETVASARNVQTENGAARASVPGPSSTVTSGALQEMSPSTGAIRKTTMANSGGINRMQRAVESSHNNAATTSAPERQLRMEVDDDSDLSTDDEMVGTNFAETYVPTDGECESDCTIVYEDWQEEEPADLQAELNDMLAQSAAEHEAARAARNRRSPLPQWPARDPNAPRVTDTPPVCYRRGERFMPYDLQIIMMRHMNEVFTAQASGTTPPRRDRITIEERQAVQRQLDMEAEMNERQGDEIGLEQPMREIALFDFVEPARPPPVEMPQDQPENRQQYDVPCVCCTERKVNTIFIPCRHAVCCWTCAMEGEYYGDPCCICRKVPELRVTMFGP
jgi:hypothetical protein